MEPQVNVSITTPSANVFVSTSLSNKKVQEGVKKKGKSIVKPIENKVNVIGVKVDKISITYGCAHEDTLLNHSLIFSKYPEFQEVNAPDKMIRIPYPLGGYKANARYYPNAEKPHFVLFQANTGKAKKSDARAEWNPAHFTSVEHDRINGVLLLLLAGETVNARVTRLDIAVDLLGIAPEDMVIEGGGKKLKTLILRNNRIETAYCGSGETLKFYDKKSQSAKESKKLGVVDPYAAYNQAVTRIEAITKPEDMMFSQLAAIMPSVFNHIKLYDTRSLEVFPRPDLQSWFLDSLKMKGAEYTLRHWTAKRAAQFHTRMNKVRIQCWDELIGQTFQKRLMQEIEKTGLKKMTAISKQMHIYKPKKTA